MPLESIILLVTTVIFVIYLISLFRVISIEHRIKRLQSEMKKKVKEQSGQGRGIPLGIVIKKQDKISYDYQEKIDDLSQKRRFILDKLPFIKR
ncbi:hypothetical protein KKF32_00560 [Patescibacteria group bacterium]|nr:hypothetical protein [Patescibacteria group bacterium]